ncbi:MAG: 16S rRNA (guanine(527)-N(7))-methyltransferase RsmG, partial [Anaerolineales bacterium]|nr:16S rRNA (guanine(527)-N(7))-methyltransferase RsmG [Anaerolineales bacterium]
MASVALDGLQESARALLGLQLTRRQLDSFRWYASELLAWNKRHNLTAITDPLGIEMKHFLDSLTCLLAMQPKRGDRVVDVGTGAGFPGLPLRIVCPKIQLTLVEATGKKADFCRHVVEELGLEGVVVLHARAEDVGHMPEHRQVYDWALARAVAQLPVLVECMLPLLRVGGKAIALKGETGPAEAHASERALRLLGGRVDSVIPIELP